MGDFRADQVRQMFAEISPRYDFLNHFLSLNLDRRWRRRLAREAASGGPRRILDLATGTGDLALLLRKEIPAALVAGADFCLPMLDRARRKAAPAAPDRLVWTAADALKLPFRDGSFDLVTVAFGLRNFADRPASLAEIRRVTAEGGRLLVLEFSMDLAPVFGGAYRFYFRHVLPHVGRWISGSDAYAYLNRSAEELPGPSRIVGLIREAGFSSVEARRLTGGSVVLYLAEIA